MEPGFDFSLDQSKLLSMRAGQGCAEFAATSFGAGAANGDTAWHVGRIPPTAAHLGGAAQHHRRTAAGAAPRPGALHAKSTPA
jgi:hypothetical protein